MGVPSGLSGHLISLHGLIAGNQILNGACFNMSDMRTTVCRGRTVKERKDITAFPFREGLFHNTVSAPEFEDFLLALHKVQGCRHFVVHGFLSS